MDKVKAVLTLAAALAFALSPLLSDGFAGFTPDQFPVPQVDPPAQPAGYAFAIWGLIYLWLIAGAAFGLLNRDIDRGWDRTRWPLIASLVVGAAWIPAAQVSPPAATVMIWWMAVTAILALLRAGRHDRLWLQAPLALYAGWLTAAACVALALVLAGHGITGQQSAAVLTIALALAISVSVLRARPAAPEYAAAVVWALVAIGAANATGPDAPNWTVLALCGVGVVLLVGQVWARLPSSGGDAA